MNDGYVLNKPTAITCPECGGVLSKLESHPIPRYACHIGHKLTAEAVLEAQADRIESLLTGTLALLNERRELCRQLLQDGAADTVRIDAIFSDATNRAEIILGFLNTHGGRPAVAPDISEQAY